MSSVEFDGNDGEIGKTSLFSSGNIGGFMGGGLSSSSLSVCWKSIWFLGCGKQMRFVENGVTKLTNSGEEGEATQIIIESGVKSSSRGQYFSRASCIRSCIKLYLDLTMGGMSQDLGFGGDVFDASREFCLTCSFKMLGRIRI